MAYLTGSLLIAVSSKGQNDPMGQQTLEGGTCDAGRVSESYLDLEEFMILSIWEATTILFPLGFQVRWPLFEGSFSLRSVLRVAG